MFLVYLFQEEYRKLEVLAFDMERTIVSLEEQLATANDESQQAVIRSESLVQEVEELSDKLEYSNSELERFEEMVSSLVSFSKIVFGMIESRKEWNCSFLRNVIPSIFLFKILILIFFFKTYYCFRGQTWKKQQLKIRMQIALLVC